MDRVLTLGNVPTIVQSVEVTQTHDQARQAFADTLAQQALTLQKWEQADFATLSSSEITRVIRSVAAHIEPFVGPLPFAADAVVAKAASELCTTHQLLIRWVMEINIGMADIWQYVMRTAAVSFITPQRGFSVGDLIVDVAQTYPVAVMTPVMSQNHGPMLLFRGYRTVFGNDAVYVGTERNNIWNKDVNMVPGIRHLDAILAARRTTYLRKLRQKQSRPDMTLEQMSKAEKECLQSQLAYIESSFDTVRPKFIDEKRFIPACGQRLDLENVTMMQTALDMARAFRAKVLYERYEQLIDNVCGQCGCSKVELLQDPDVAGDMADRVREYIDGQAVAVRFHNYVGAVTLPSNYLCFSPTATVRALEGESFVLLEGVGGKCLPVNTVYRRPDHHMLLRSEAVLRQLQDFRQVVEQSGYLQRDGKRVADYLEDYRVGDMIFETRAAAVTHLSSVPPGQVQRIEKYVVYILEGESTPREMRYDAFRASSKYVLVPQILASSSGAELQFFQNGMHVGLDDSDVHNRFRGRNEKYHVPR